MLTIKSLDTNYINIDTDGSINVDGGIYVKQIAPIDGTDIINIGGNIYTENGISCSSLYVDVIIPDNEVDGLMIEGVGITCNSVMTKYIDADEGLLTVNGHISSKIVYTDVISTSNEDEYLTIENAGLICDNINTNTIVPSGSILTVTGDITTENDIECQNITINGKSSFNNIQGTNMVFSNIDDKNVIIKSLIKNNEFVAVAYTPDINGTNHNVHSFIRLNSDGIVFWGSSIQLYADDLVSYPHGSYIDIEKIHNY